MSQLLVDAQIAEPTEIPDEPLDLMYIGDDESLAELYKLKLELDGYRVTRARTVAESLDEARRRPPDIIYLDAGSSQPVTFDALARLRHEPGLNETPIVILWYGPSDPSAAADLELSVKDFLVTAIGVPTEEQVAARASRTN